MAYYASVDDVEGRADHHRVSATLPVMLVLVSSACSNETSAERSKKADVTKSDGIEGIRSAYLKVKNHCEQLAGEMGLSVFASIPVHYALNPEPPALDDVQHVLNLTCDVHTKRCWGALLRKYPKLPDKPISDEDLTGLEDATITNALGHIYTIQIEREISVMTVDLDNHLVTFVESTQTFKGRGEAACPPRSSAKP